MANSCRYYIVILVLVFAGLCASLTVAAETPDDFYNRLKADVEAGKPFVTSVYVALCDNDSQGIVPVRNRSICNGDDPRQNMYWNGSGGVRKYLKKQGWKRVYKASSDGDILRTDVWKRAFLPGRLLKAKGITKRFTGYIVAMAYRGSRIHQANIDYLKAVNTDVADEIILSESETLNYGGAGHIAVYVGHDYFMDAYDGTSEHAALMEVHRNGKSVLAKGTMALACVSNDFVRPAVTRPNVYILVMNNYLTFPSAWTIGGVIKGIVGGGDGYNIYVEAARAFARGQKTGMTWAKKAFSYGE